MFSSLSFVISSTPYYFSCAPNIISATPGIILSIPGIISSSPAIYYSALSLNILRAQFCILPICKIRKTSKANERKTDKKSESERF